jgi:hypothetical protein
MMMMCQSSASTATSEFPTLNLIDVLFAVVYFLMTQLEV